MSELVQGRGGVLLGQKIHRSCKSENSADLRNFLTSTGLFFFTTFFELTLVAAKMTTAVVSPFFDFEVMNKVL